MGSYHRDISGRGLHEPATYKVYNDTGSTLAKGTVVKRAGYGAVIKVAISTNPLTDNRIGIVLDDITDGTIGWVAAMGDFGEFDTSAFLVDDILYSNGSGALVTGGIGDPIATVLSVHATNGHLFCYVPLPVGAGGGVAAAYENYTYVVSPTDITNGYITLPISPNAPTETVLLLEGAPTQVYGIDFTVAGAVLTFVGLAGDIDSGETVTILYR